jgi:hypothetical protein
MDRFLKVKSYLPNMDGHIFPDQPLKLITEGKYPTMPVIIGNTSQETLPAALAREWQLTRLARARSDAQAWLTSHALIARLGEDALRFLE